MKKSLTINATRNGKKVSKSLGYVNPDVANSLVGGFAQMVNALSTDTFVNAEVVKKMDTNEQEQQSGGGGQQSGSVDSNFRFFDVDSATNEFNVTRGMTKTVVCTGDGTLAIVRGLSTASGVEANFATLDGRTITLAPPNNTSGGLYEFFIDSTNSQGVATRYPLYVNVIVPA